MADREAQILLEMRTASLARQTVLAEELDAIRASRRAQLAVERELDLAAPIVAAIRTPVVPHVMHTASTDWIGKIPDAPVADAHQLHVAARAEATRWFRKLADFVKADEEEYSEQAEGVGRRWASQYGMQADDARSSFVQQAMHLAGYKTASTKCPWCGSAADGGVCANMHCARYGDSGVISGEGWATPAATLDVHLSQLAAKKDDDDGERTTCSCGFSTTSTAAWHDHIFEGPNTSRFKKGHERVSSRKTAATCSCANNSDGTVTKFLCSVHADNDPCATMASVTGGRRKGSIVNGVCTNCGWTARKEGARKTALSDEEYAKQRVIEQWCDSQGLVMKDFPDSLIDQAMESGDTSILSDWLMEGNEPNTEFSREGSRKQAVQGGPHCPDCGSDDVDGGDSGSDADYYNEMRCNKCKATFPSAEAIGYDQAQGMRNFTRSGSRTEASGGYTDSGSSCPSCGSSSVIGGEKYGQQKCVSCGHSFQMGDKKRSSKTADQGFGPDDNSQSGHAESGVEQVGVTDNLDTIDFGWIQGDTEEEGAADLGDYPGSERSQMGIGSSLRTGAEEQPDYICLSCGYSDSMGDEGWLAEQGTQIACPNCGSTRVETSDVPPSRRAPTDAYVDWMNTQGAIHTAAARPLYEIAAEIRADWKKVNYAAVPYLDAMSDLTSMTDMYFQDPAEQIVAYFLSNATSWKGDVARRVKQELRSMSRYGSLRTAVYVAAPPEIAASRPWSRGESWSLTCPICGETETGTDYYNGWPSQDAFHNHLFCGHDPDADYHQDLAIDRYSNRRTAMHLTNVGLEGDVGVGTDPSGNRVRFRLTPKDVKDLSAVLYSDLAVNFDGVDIEQSDIITEGSLHSAARAQTKFTVCPAHQRLFAGESRDRMAEWFAEGGPGSGLPCSGEGCRIAPGTDLFSERVCNQEYDTRDRDPSNPFQWAVNSGKSEASRRIADIGFGPDPNSQSGYAETALDQVDATDDLDTIGFGWSQGEENAPGSDAANTAGQTMPTAHLIVNTAGQRFVVTNGVVKPLEGEPIRSIAAEMSEEARELDLWAENDADLYRQSYVPVVKNLQNHREKGRFDRELAIKGLMYYVDEAARRYTKEFGSGGGMGVFTKEIRREVAEATLAHLEAEWDLGNFISSRHTASGDDDDGGTYKIIRFYQDENKDKEIIDTGLTLEEAQEHCNRDDTHGDGWFDGYDKEASLRAQADAPFAGNEDGTVPAGADPMIQPGAPTDTAMFEPDEIEGEPPSDAADVAGTPAPYQASRLPFVRAGDRDITPEMQVDIDAAAAALGDLGHDFKGDDWYDLWGTAMGWAFAINDRISELGGSTNPTYDNKGNGPDAENYNYQMLVEVGLSVDQLEKAERIIDGLLDKAIAAGRDY